MIVSRRLVSLGTKFCLFVYYVKQINNKQWMAKKIIALNASMWNRTMEGRILFLEDDRWNLLRFTVVASNFRYASDYTMASDMFLLPIGSIKS
jgi:hypothetical protein